MDEAQFAAFIAHAPIPQLTIPTLAQSL